MSRKIFYFCMVNQIDSPFRLNYVPVLNIYGGRSLHTGEAGANKSCRYKLVL
ncbi:MAG: hypothetical protein IJQ63_06250 [Synergistaceae bacterium]|nr:hypothetical protein [Synergistaceae bacterium]